jgi:hypothetical protein
VNGMNNYEKLLILLLIVDAVIYMLSLYLISIRGLLLLIFFIIALIIGLVINVIREERGTIHETKT